MRRAVKIRPHRGWRAREHERHGVGILVRDEPAFEQRVDESRRRRASDLPLRLRPPACAQCLAYLGKHLVHLFQWEALPLDGVPGRSGADAERVAVGLDPLVALRQRPEGVRVFRYLTQHPLDATSVPEVEAADRPHGCG